MGTKINDKRHRIMNTEFFDLEVGGFFQDDAERSYQDSICMKTSNTTALRFISDGSDVKEEDWSTIRHTPIIPLKATITVERGE